MSRFKWVLSLVFSAAFLAFIYLQFPIQQLWGAVSDLHWGWATLGLSLFLPIILVVAWRFWLMTPPSAGLGYWASVRLVFISFTLNVILPSKMGDVAKAYFLKRDHQQALPFSLALVLFEKICDMLGVFSWGVISLFVFAAATGKFWEAAFILLGFIIVGVVCLFSRRLSRFGFRVLLSPTPISLRPKVRRLFRAWRRMQNYLRSQHRRVFFIGVQTALVSFINLIQIWCLIFSVGVAVPMWDAFALSTLSILAGLLPFTMSGIGTRDAALVVLFAPYMVASKGALLGILTTLRYVVPGILGILFFSGGVKRVLRKEIVFEDATNRR